MVSNDNLFNETERSLMNETPIWTRDSNNKLIYQTSDKIYLITSKATINNNIYAGSADQKTINIASYDYRSDSGWYNGWLRNEYDITSTSYVKLSNSSYVDYINIIPTDKDCYIIPASNLNLTDVLFASVSKAHDYDDNGIRTVIGISDKSMILRIDGSDKNLGTITYADNKITVKPKQNVSLIVQGKTNNKDWYYSQDISEETTVSANSIKEKLEFSNDIDFNSVKIWIEITDEDGVIYAVEANTITEINVDVDTPEPLKSLDNEISSDTDGISIEKFNWDKNDDSAKFNETYTISIELKVQEGFKLWKNVKAKVSGNNAKLTLVDDILTITYEFTTKKDVIQAIEQPTITVPNGTDISTIVLPNKVEVTGESKKTYQVEISSWASNPSNTYDPNSKDKQELKYAASIKEIPSELEYGNPDGPDTILTIIVEAAESTPTPTPVPPSSSPSTTDDGYVVPNTGVK